MKKGLKKTVAVAVVASMAMSFTACGLDKEAVADAAEAFAKAVATHDYAKISKLASKVDEEYETTLDLDNGSYSDDQIAVIEAIVDTISYEVDEDSIEGDKTSATADIVFTMVDYEAVLDDEDNLVDVDTCLDAIADGETTEIKVTAEFDIDGDDYTVTNFGDFAKKMFGYLDIDVEFGSALADSIEYADWWWCDYDAEGQYTNTNQIDLELTFMETADLDAVAAVYSEISYNGEVVGTKDGRDAWYYTYDVDASCLDESGMYFAAGEYTITFFDGNGNEFYSDVATVFVEEVEIDISDCSVYWYFAGGDNTYDEGTTLIDGDLENYSSYDVYYTVEFEGSLVYTGDGYEGYYGDGYGTDGDALPNGVYTITFYDANDNVIVSDSCVVGEGGSTGTDVYDDVGTVEFYDQDFQDLMIEAGWWDYDGTMIADGVYNTDTATIAFSCEVDSSVTDSIFYAYYYSEDGEFEDMSLDSYVAGETITPTNYANGQTYYDIDYTPSSMVEGYYILIIADDANFTTPLMASACQVVAE